MVLLYGRVLVGLDIPRNDESAFNEFISKLGFRYHIENNNASIHAFLSSGEID